MEIRTKQIFAEALKTLMKNKHLMEIRISEICDICNANRRTFYYHFEDKYDLVAWMMTSYAHDSIEQIPQFGIGRMVYSLNEGIRELDFRKKLYSDPGFSNCFDFMIRQYNDHYNAQLTMLAGRDLTDNERLSIRMLSYAVIYMIREWYLDDNRMDAEEYVKCLVDSFPAWIQELMQVPRT